jgi:hypothetical protein
LCIQHHQQKIVKVFVLLGQKLRADKIQHLFCLLLMKILRSRTFAFDDVFDEAVVFQFVFYGAAAVQKVIRHGIKHAVAVRRLAKFHGDIAQLSNHGINHVIAYPLTDLFEGHSGKKHTGPPQKFFQLFLPQIDFIF